LCVNPDGYYYNEVTDPDGGGMWRKNRRDNGDGSWGVDLNRNYGYEWGYDNYGSSPYPSDPTYRGPSAFSEAETQAMRDFIISRDFVVTVSYHSHGNLFLYPWGYDHFLTPNHELFVMMGDSATAINGYDPMPVFQFYVVNGGTDDWGYGEQTLKNKNYAVSLEVGGDLDGFWPPTSRITPLVEEHLEANLFYARMADNPEGMLPPAPPVVYCPGEISTSSFELVWSHDDEFNPAVSYQVWQYRGLTRVTDDLEFHINSWALDGFEWSSARSYSGNYSFYSENNSDADHTALAVNSINVTAGDSVTFWTWYDIETDWDYGYVEVSVDGQTWTSIPGNITTTSNPHGNNLGHGITGSSGGWQEATFDLSAYQDESIYLRFRYVSDSYVNEEGWYVDDIYPVESFAEELVLGLGLTDTTLLVEGLEEDEYYYQVFALDAESQKSVGSNLGYVSVNFGPACEWLVGDADGDELINVSDAVYLIGYIFAGGPAPTPHEVGSGDADCSGVVNISDAVFTLSYIFAGGPPPGDGCSCEDYL
jgi:hypothetical protein